MGAAISADAIDTLTDHLDTFDPDGRCPKISLILHSAGGSILAGWTIANLIRQFCRTAKGLGHFEVIVPAKAHSTATVISLAANTIVMTKQATLGAIDPSVNSPLNPPVPEDPQKKVQINVECVASFMELARKELTSNGKTKPSVQEMIPAFSQLAQHINPYVLGAVYRSREQIRELAKKLLENHMNAKTDKALIQKIIEKLSSTSGSHDYTICRTEALELGLPVEKPNLEQYGHIKAIYDDLSSELELRTPWNPNGILKDKQSANYQVKRGLIETISHGSDCYLSTGTLQRIAMPTANGMALQAVQDDRTMDRWTHVSDGEGESPEDKS
jgi:hypothetical protein